MDRADNPRTASAGAQDRTPHEPPRPSGARDTRGKRFARRIDCGATEDAPRLAGDPPNRSGRGSGRGNGAPRRDR
jgi:hypothetical protein